MNEYPGVEVPPVVLPHRESNGHSHRLPPWAGPGDPQSPVPVADLEGRPIPGAHREDPPVTVTQYFDPEDLEQGELEPGDYPAPAGPSRPYLLHSGVYALYRTPGGLFHLTYRQTAGTHPETGQVTAIDGAADMHCRDLPEQAANMAAMLIDRDTPLPPLLEAVVFGGVKPKLGTLMKLARDYADVEEAGDDGPG